MYATVLNNKTRAQQAGKLLLEASARGKGQRNAVLQAKQKP